MKYVIVSEVGEKVGRTKHAEDAAALVRLYGTGAEVRVGREVVWTEGIDVGVSFDACANTIRNREKV